MGDDSDIHRRQKLAAPSGDDLIPTGFTDEPQVCGCDERATENVNHDSRSANELCQFC